MFAAGLLMPAPRSDSLLMESLAEAWHVDGEFGASARTWIALCNATRNWTFALNAAAALVSLGSMTPWRQWFERARSFGAPAEDYWYYYGLALWRTGDTAGAEEALATASDTELGGSDRSRNALAALLRRTGRKAEAADIWRRQWLAGSAHPLALVNAARAGRPVPAEDAVRRAVRTGVHEPAPFVCLGNLLQAQGAVAEAGIAYAKARLRLRWAGAVPTLAETTIGTPDTRVDVDGTVDGEGCDLRIQVRGPGIRRLVVNAGYRVVVDGIDVQPTGDPPPELPFVSPTASYDLPGDEPAGHHLRLVGRPRGPGAVCTDDYIELDFRSGWLPLVVPPRRVAWTINIRPDPRLVLDLSETDASMTGPGMLATRPRAWLQPGPVPPGGQPPAGALRRWYDAGRAVWTPVLGPTPDPPLVLVPAGRSTYCYARPNFVRVASGMLHQPAQWSQLAHEAAHGWWGGTARFVPSDEWFAEALAEFTLHELDDRGLCPGYRRTSLETAAALAATAKVGLAALSGEPGRVSAYLVRVKGAFFIGHLKAVLGDQRFERWLRALLDAGRTRPLRAYDAVALASRVSGHSLNWLANEWLFEPVEPVVDLTHTSCRTDDAWYCEVRAVSRSVMTFGVAVPLLLRTEDGAERAAAVCLDAGHDVASIRAAAPVVDVDLDPDRRLWLWSRSPDGGPP